MTRKLVTIQKIIDLRPIEKADAIECASILGWHVVVKKGEFKVGDSCVYFEIDSLLPTVSEFDFLSKSGVKKSYTDGKEYEGYRLKTIRLRGQISQGLCLPISILKGKKYPSDSRKNPVYKLGADVTSLLGVVKYEPVVPANLTGQAKELFPSFIPKTDETRIQFAPKVLERHAGKVFYVTEKVDGASCTIFIKDGELNCCSRNLNLLDDPTNTFWKVAKEISLLEKIKKVNENIALQGELVGDNVQGNKLKINGQKILFFNAYNFKEGRHLNFSEFISLCRELEIPTVPIISKKYILPKTVDELVDFATRKSLLSPETWVEGIVIRSLEEDWDEELGRLSFKVINPEFLLAFGD